MALSTSHFVKSAARFIPFPFVFSFCLLHPSLPDPFGFDGLLNSFFSCLLAAAAFSPLTSKPLPQPSLNFFSCPQLVGRTQAHELVPFMSTGELLQTSTCFKMILSTEILWESLKLKDFKDQVFVLVELQWRYINVDSLFSQLPSCVKL